MLCPGEREGRGLGGGPWDPRGRTGSRLRHTGLALQSWGCGEAAGLSRSPTLPGQSPNKGRSGDPINMWCDPGHRDVPNFLELTIQSAGTAQMPGGALNQLCGTQGGAQGRREESCFRGWGCVWDRPVVWARGSQGMPSNDRIGKMNRNLFFNEIQHSAFRNSAFFLPSGNQGRFAIKA